MITFQQRVDFFMCNADLSWYPAKESPYAGKLVCAMDLAAAEIWLDNTTQVNAIWEEDTDYMECERPEYMHFLCYLKDSEGNVLASLGGIDLGPEGPQFGKHWTDPARAHERVVEVQLALEAAARYEQGNS